MRPELFHIPPSSEGNDEVIGGQMKSLVEATGIPEFYPPIPQLGADHLGEKNYARLAELLSGYVGIRLPPTKRVMMEGRLRRRVRALGLPSLSEYCRLLFTDNSLLDTEFIHLVDAITTNKTDFFREPQHFDFLRNEIVPNLLASRRPTGGYMLKLWSAASSNGAEAYSIAMLLDDMAHTAGPFRFAILGTDISTEMLAHAIRAVYPEEMIQPIPKPMRMRYLMRARSSEQSNFRIVPELRRICRFVRLNLMDQDYPFDRDVDVIFLRNVLIYFDKPTQEAVVCRLVGHLRPGGYLLVGHSESMIGTNARLRQVAPAVFQHL